MTGKEAGEAERPGDDEIVLGLLDAVHANIRVSQRSLASELGIALGLTNAYLKRCVRKGLVKVRKAPPNRYAYYLTPKGFTEKSRLTARYLGRSFGFYRTARNEIDELLGACAERGWTSLTLCGPGELAEIAILCATQHPVSLIEVYGPRAQGESFMGLRLAKTVEDLANAEAYLITDMKRPQAMFDVLSAHAGADRVVAPRLLKIDAEHKEGAS
jgi:DNA-binding MarR family transcriptional regulator